MAELYNIRFESLFGEAGGEISQNLEKVGTLNFKNCVDSIKKSISQAFS